MHILQTKTLKVYKNLLEVDVMPAYSFQYSNHKLAYIWYY